MTSQNKVTAAVVQHVFPEKGLITVKHGKVHVSEVFLVLFCFFVFLSMVIVETIKRLLWFQRNSYYFFFFFFFSAASKEEKPESKDLLADLQDISDNERKTSTAESSLGELNCNLQI